MSAPCQAHTMLTFWQVSERRSPCFFPGDARCPHSVSIKSQTRCGEPQKRSIMGCEGEHRHIKKWYWLQIIHVPRLIATERNRTARRDGHMRCRDHAWWLTFRLETGPHSPSTQDRAPVWSPDQLGVCGQEPDFNTSLSLAFYCLVITQSLIKRKTKDPKANFVIATKRCYPNLPPLCGIWFVGKPKWCKLCFRTGGTIAATLIFNRIIRFALSWSDKKHAGVMLIKITLTGARILITTALVQ